MPHVTFCLSFIVADYASLRANCLRSHMVSFGSKALPSRKSKNHSITEGLILISREDNCTYNKQDRLIKSMGRKPVKKKSSSNGSFSSKNASNGNSMNGRSGMANRFPKQQEASSMHASFVRKQVDPETAKYFSEISNVLETGIDWEERVVISNNALQETRGKEVELATDHIISHTLQMLLESCDADHLCSFLGGCANNFVTIATDSGGSHVAETALKSLAVHNENEDYHTLIKDTLTSICQAVILKPIDMLCNCYGSHVLRSLLCFCKGVALGSDFHAAKPSTILAQRLNLKANKRESNDPKYVHPGFPDLLKLLVSEISNRSKADVTIMRADQYSSLVLQTALKLLASEESLLLSIIPVILGCDTGNTEKENLICVEEGQNIRDLMKENAFSHLMEVLLELAPGVLYDQIFERVFRTSLFDMSCHQSANFVVQALISHARCQSHIEAIWEELGSKFKDLFEKGKSGVVACLIAASHRLNTHEQKCSKALAATVCSAHESPDCIIPRLLFLDSYIFCEDKFNWSWKSGLKVHVMGSLILQSIFKYPSQFIQPYVTSITSMESAHVLETAKDASGARVLEAFLDSDASDKHKKKLVSKLKCHYGELSMYPVGCFTVEKCFNVVDVPLREAIVSDLVTVQKELFRTKQGPFLLKNLDVDGYSRQPEHWRSRQKSKLSVYKEFLATFTTEEPASSKKKRSLPEDSNKATQQSSLKKMRQEIDSALTSFSAESKKRGLHEGGRKDEAMKRSSDKSSKKKQKLNKGEIHSSGNESSITKMKKHYKKDDQSRVKKKKKI